MPIPRRRVSKPKTPEQIAQKEAKRARAGDTVDTISESSDGETSADDI